MANWEEIKQIVESNSNIGTFSMETLREAHGSGKLGVHVRFEISKKLAGMGLGHVPQELPSYQHQQVRLYKRGTPVGELIETVLAPGEQNDRKLVEQIAGASTDYATIVERIRELVAE
jgi:hypothetical protein